MDISISSTRVESGADVVLELLKTVPYLRDLSFILKFYLYTVSFLYNTRDLFLERTEQLEGWRTWWLCVDIVFGVLSTPR